MDDDSLTKMQNTLKKEGAMGKIISVRMGKINTAKGQEVKVDESLLTTASVLYDAVFIAAGNKSISAIRKDPKAKEFVKEAYSHCKTIAADGEGGEWLMKILELEKDKNKDAAILIDASGADFVKAVAKHRFWPREAMLKNLPEPKA